MRTNLNAVVTNNNVFGLDQDRVVVSLTNEVSCAHAAQHLASRHACKRERSSSRGYKRRGTSTTFTAGAVLMAMQHLLLAIWGLQWQPVRRLSPVPVSG